MVIGWFPYHSVVFAAPKKKFGRCPSQAYSFHLARKMLDDGRLIVRMRGKAEWLQADPLLGTTDSLKNPQCGYLTMGNMNGELYNRVLQALRA